MEISNKEKFYLNHIKNTLTDKGQIMFFDIGCNKGFYTKYLLELFGSDNHFHLFEASDRFFEISKNKFIDNNSVSVYNYAVSDSEGTIDLFELESSDDDVEGMSSVNNRPVFQKYKTNKKTVPAITIDSFIESNKISHINFIKIDTEGHELSVLSGMKNILKEKIVDFIQIEYGDCLTEIGKNLRDVLSFLSDYEYTLFDGSNNNLREINEENVSQFLNSHWDNFLIIKND